MLKVTINVEHPDLDGVYELDEWNFTNWELHAVKRATGMILSDFTEGKLDNDLSVALGMVALMRAGKISGKAPWDSEQMAVLWQAQAGRILPESDAVPPPSASGSETNAANGSSGGSSEHASENPADAPSPTGAPA